MVESVRVCQQLLLRIMSDDWVEIYGLVDAKIATEDTILNCDNALQNLCAALQLNYDDVKQYTIKGNSLLVQLINQRAVNEWERKSRESRLRLSDIHVNGNNTTKVKVFAAAPSKFKLLLHNVRKRLPNFKYIWIGKHGVLARQQARSKIFVIKNDDDLDHYVNMVY